MNKKIAIVKNPIFRYVFFFSSLLITVVGVFLLSIDTKLVAYHKGIVLLINLLAIAYFTWYYFAIIDEKYRKYNDSHNWMWKTRFVIYRDRTKSFIIIAGLLICISLYLFITKDENVAAEVFALAVCSLLLITFLIFVFLTKFMVKMANNKTKRVKVQTSNIYVEDKVQRLKVSHFDLNILLEIMDEKWGWFEELDQITFINAMNGEYKKLKIQNNHRFCYLIHELHSIIENKVEADAWRDEFLAAHGFKQENYSKYYSKMKKAKGDVDKEKVDFRVWVDDVIKKYQN